MENASLSVLSAVIITLLSALIIILERAFPFLIFAKRKPPKIISFIEKCIPPLIMACLLVYSLKDINFLAGPANYLPAIISLAVTVALHLWKDNSLLSIFGGTILYMVLIRVV